MILGANTKPLFVLTVNLGKGGVAYILHYEFGCDLPKDMHPEFSKVIQGISDETGQEVIARDIWNAFSKTYLDTNKPYEFVNFLSASLIEKPGTSAL